MNYFLLFNFIICIGSDVDRRWGGGQENQKGADKEIVGGIKHRWALNCRKISIELGLEIVHYDRISRTRKYLWWNISLNSVKFKGNKRHRPLSPPNYHFHLFLYPVHYPLFLSLSWEGLFCPNLTSVLALLFASDICFLIDSFLNNALALGSVLNNAPLHLRFLHFLQKWWCTGCIWWWL